MTPLSIDALSPMRHATLTVTVRLRNLWRLRLGVRILRLAARVLGCNVVVVELDGGSP